MDEKLVLYSAILRLLDEYRLVPITEEEAKFRTQLAELLGV